MFKFLKKRNTLSPHFCIAPFVQMDLNEQGHVNACCKAKDVLGYWSSEKISKIWNDDPIKKLRESFLEGSKPKGCRSCWEEEESGLISRRQDYNSKFSGDVSEIKQMFSVSGKEELLTRPLKFHGLDIGFSAQCSLMCRMCGPSASSSWLSKAIENKSIYKYYAELGELNPRVIETNFKDFLSEELFEDFCQKVAPTVSDLMINGGEPLASRHHFLFFSKMKNEDLAKLKVSLTTNAQTVFYKNQSLIPYWAQLRFFNYRVSIDNVGEKYSYIRTNASLAKLQESVHLVREGFAQEPGKLRIIFTTAVSLYNIMDLPSLIKFAIQSGAINHFNWVHFPSFLSAQHIPKNLALKTLSELHDFLDHLETLGEWDQHPLWSWDFKMDKEYDFIVNSDSQGRSNTSLNTYKDFAVMRIRIQIQEVIVFLEKNFSEKPLSNDFKSHVLLMDQVFATQFEKVYKEYLPYF